MYKQNEEFKMAYEFNKANMEPIAKLIAGKFSEPEYSLLFSGATLTKRKNHFEICPTYKSTVKNDGGSICVYHNRIEICHGKKVKSRLTNTESLGDSFFYSLVFEAISGFKSGVADAIKLACVVNDQYKFVDVKFEVIKDGMIAWLDLDVDTTMAFIFKSFLADEMDECYFSMCHRVAGKLDSKDIFKEGSYVYATCDEDAKKLTTETIINHVNGAKFALNAIGR
ncbi:hypothetical protein HLBENOHH_02451 [Aeromonas dhakensis]|uniref:hypothetical protein n=1 Tax=Aeromonas dhakensis TaxID=196024 RepID=UPI00366B71E6